MAYYVAVCCSAFVLRSKRIIGAPMPKRKLLLPNTIDPARPLSSIPAPQLQFSPAVWARLESAYCCKIPVLIRRQIEEAGRNYVWLASMENEAKPFASAKNNVSAVRKTAAKLLQELRSIQDCDDDVRSFVGHLIRQRLKLPSQRPLGDHLGGFVRDLEVLAHTLADLDVSQSRDGQKKGRAWAAWAMKIRAILKDAGLPHTVSKDTRSASDSPFVRLLAALQQVFPHRYRPFTQMRSLAEAICRAARAGAFSRRHAVE
jgi:hypothetical protein